MELKNYILSPIFSNVCFRHSFVTVSNSNSFFFDLANLFQTCFKMPEDTILVCTSYFLIRLSTIKSFKPKKSTDLSGICLSCSRLVHKLFR